MDKPISKAKLQQRLKVDVEFTGEFIGANRKFCVPGNEVVRRRVVRQSKHGMVCVLLGGPKEGQETSLTWSGCEAVERDDSVILVNSENGEEFLKITF